jgi:hypothetical protein
VYLVCDGERPAGDEEETVTRVARGIQCGGTPVCLASPRRHSACPRAGSARNLRFRRRRTWALLMFNKAVLQSIRATVDIGCGCDISGSAS